MEEEVLGPILLLPAPPPAPVLSLNATGRFNPSLASLRSLRGKFNILGKAFA